MKQFDPPPKKKTQKKQHRKMKNKQKNSQGQSTFTFNPIKP